MRRLLLAIARRAFGGVSPSAALVASCEPVGCAGPHRWQLIALTSRERIYECRSCPTRWKSIAVVFVDADGFEARIWTTPPR